MPNRSVAGWSLGRYAYLFALALPCVSLVQWLRAPYHLYQFEAWSWLALVPICLVQFLRPTLVGWVLVVGGYVWSVLLQIQQHLGAFEDFGSDDHSRWEGWGAEFAFLGLTAWCLGVLVALVVCRPTNANAT